MFFFLIKKMYMYVYNTIMDWNSFISSNLNIQTMYIHQTMND